MSPEASARVRQLLLSADNALKNAGPGLAGERAGRVRATLEEARGVADDPGIAQPVRDLVERRIAALDELEAADGRPG